MARRSAPPQPLSPSLRLRCAIYTRKSSEEGLEQEFNSLHAQREACAAYVASQRHEGWTVLPQPYDDGGFSGGTTERPALQRLLADIAAGLVDVVVVYKVDRLTRALPDFARIVELFDANRVSFVSVTQAFNTTTSMGRLTLNVLLSFAQFEREVTGERIRDKIAASKKKGMWMGGLPPLGYDVADRKLVVNEAEASTVRHIFRRYAELRSVRDLKAELDATGIVSKARRAADGTVYGSQRLARGALYAMLSNRLYRGEITHKDAVYPGEHQAIVDEALWLEVQQTLETNRVDRQTRSNSTDASLLTGLAFDAAGEALTPTFASKKGTRYRYYVSRHLITGAPDGRGQRLPAPALESLVRTAIGERLGDATNMLEAGRQVHLTADAQGRMVKAAGRAATTWDALPSVELREAIRAFTTRVQVHAESIMIAIDPHRLAAWLGEKVPHEAADAATDADPLTWTIPVRMKRRGNELRMVIEGAADEIAPNSGLMRLVALAHHIRQRLLHDRASIDDVAREQGINPSYVTRALRVAFLAPDIIAALMSGRHDPDLSARKMIVDTRYPTDWASQRAAFRIS